VLVNMLTAIIGSAGSPAQGGGGCQGQTCDSTCAAYLQTNLIDPMGCCWGTFLNIATRYGGSDSSTNSLSTINTDLQAMCGLTFSTTPCPRPSKEIKLALRLSNIAYAWIAASDANAQAFRAAIRNDIATYFGAALADVDATASASAAAAVSVNMVTGRFGSLSSSRRGFRTLDGGAAATSASVSVQMDSDVAVTNGQGAASQAIADGTLDLTAVAGLPSAAKVNPADSSGGAGLDAAASTSTTDNAPSAGAAVVPTVSAVLVVLFSLVTLLF